MHNIFPIFRLHYLSSPNSSLNLKLSRHYSHLMFQCTLKEGLQWQIRYRIKNHDTPQPMHASINAIKSFPLHLLTQRPHIILVHRMMLHCLIPHLLLFHLLTCCEPPFHCAQDLLSLSDVPCQVLLTSKQRLFFVSDFSSFVLK